MAIDEKDAILESIPADLREKGSTVYSSLIDGKVWKGIAQPIIYKHIVSLSRLQYANQLLEAILTRVKFTIR